MRVRATITAAVVGVSALFAVAGHVPEGCYVVDANSPDTEDDDVLACSEQHWFHTATTLANTVGHVAAAHGLATFDTTPPAGSVTGGNGGGYLGTQAVGFGDDLAYVSFTGTFTGVLDSLDVDLHTLTGIRPQSVPVLGDLDVLAELTLIVDGVEFEWLGPDDAGVYLYAVPEESSQAGSMRLDFSFTGFYDELKARGMENTESTEHTVTFELREFPTISGTIYAFDTTEVPGGITFNALELPELQLPA